MDLSPDLARKLLTRDFANLAQRVQRGGNLSRPERAMLRVWRPRQALPRPPWRRTMWSHERMGKGGSSLSRQGQNFDFFGPEAVGAKCKVLFRLGRLVATWRHGSDSFSLPMK
jgi:hypothetical protein